MIATMIHAAVDRAAAPEAQAAALEAQAAGQTAAIPTAAEMMTAMTRREDTAVPSITASLTTTATEEVLPLTVEATGSILRTRFLAPRIS